MNNTYEVWLIEELHKIEGFPYKDIKLLHQYPLVISKQVLRILIENSCLGQNDAPIRLGRKRINEINKSWLRQHFLEVAQACINFSDEWEYRRLVELTLYAIPELKEQVLELGANSENEEVREIIDNYKYD